MSDLKLPSSPYINTDIGLKYLNNNKKLYHKVLNNFLLRYETLDIEILNEEEFKSTMHTLKGLSATLGMESLTDLAQTLYTSQCEEKCNEFSLLLKLIIADLKT